MTQELDKQFGIFGSAIFADWKEAHTQAVLFARQRGKEVGLGKYRELGAKRDSFKVFPLPKRENRYGHELRCEVVSPDDPL